MSELLLEVAKDEVEGLRERLRELQREVKYRDEIIGLLPGGGDRHAALVAEIERLRTDLAACRERMVKAERENLRLQEMWQEEHAERLQLERDWSRLRDQYDRLLKKYLDKRNEEAANG